MRGELNPTQVFLLYALPVLETCIPNDQDAEKARGELENILLSGEDVGDDFLMNYYPNAIKRRNEFSEKMGIGDRHVATVRYWREGHNPYVRDDLCKVSFAKVEDVYEVKGVIVASYDGSKKVVVPSYHRDLEKGDKISIHSGHVAEILSDKDFEKYG